MDTINNLLEVDEQQIRIAQKSDISASRYVFVLDYQCNIRFGYTGDNKQIMDNHLIS